MTNESSFMQRLFKSKHFNLIAAAVIAVMVLAAYSNSFHDSFHFDDDAQISENPAIKNFSSENILGLLRGVRPVVSMSLLMNYYLGGLNVVGYHVFNIAVHIINSVLVYFLIMRTLSLPSLRQRYGYRAGGIGLFAALLFAVHPIQTEAVTYIISRSELLATVFYLAAFLFFIKAAETGKIRYTAGMFVASALSMASKQWAVTLPAMLVVYDFLFLSSGKGQALMSRWYLFLLSALTWPVALQDLHLFAPGGQAGVGFKLVSISGVTPSTYFYTSMNVLWTYIRLLFVPIGQNIDYDYPIARTLFGFPTLLSFLGHVAVVVAAFLLYRRKKWTLVPFGIAWFYIGISPMQTFVPVVDVIFEHRMYMPSIGLFLIFALFLDSLFDWLGRRKKADATAPETAPAQKTA